jgi:hypothetical protein
MCGTIPRPTSSSAEENMKFDLVRPCDACPFRTSGEQHIIFADRGRAEEIAESAYREGFVCHEHADCIEDDPFLEEGFYPRIDGSSQHCFGAIYMYLRNGSGNVPWEHATEEDEELEQRWWDHMTLEQLAAADKLVFESEEAFLDSHGDED